jgi:NAD(P)-dependent dehydrogenase (short-subunit alcohol dehydrogenase family)
MAERGWRVFAGVRKPADAERLRALGGTLEPVSVDVVDARQVQDAAALIQEKAGAAGLQGLVNNAGIAVSGPLEHLPLADLRRQFEVNVFGLVAVTQAALPLLRAGRGRIVNMSSIAGRATSPVVGAYAASKHAVEALSDALRMELKTQGVGVAVIEPGVIRTPIWEKGRDESAVRLGALSEEDRARYAPLLDGLRKFAEKQGPKGAPPERVADAVEHALTSPRPRTRYLVGTDAKIRAFLKKLPDRWVDDMVLKRILSGGD